MFRIRAEFRDELEIGAGRQRVRSFFSDPQTFARLMPGIESITRADGKTVLWMVHADVPLIGAMRGQFALTQVDDTASRVEWRPVSGEEKNLLRYAISFEERGDQRTLVRVALRVELRRRHATELHLMAGLVGEGRISAGIKERITKMMKTYLKRARAELEG
jgi:carbon monoxide dehydrogenase subunit G